MSFSSNTIKFRFSSINNFLILFLIVFTIQFTDLKIGVVKVAEIIWLLYVPFFLFKKTNKWILAFFFFFTFWLFLTLIQNPFRDFYLLKEVSFLKTPYYISIGRYLELLACISFASYVYQYLKKKSLDEVRKFIKNVFIFCFVILIFNCLIYVLMYFDILNDSRLVYITSRKDFRLRGWFVEGGPYGLMLAFTFCLSFFYKDKYNWLYRSFVFFVIVFFAQSKAGILLIFVWIILVNYKYLYSKLKQLSLLFLVIGGILATVILFKLGDNYIENIRNIKKEINQRPDDTNLIMGRIAGVYIFPKMIEENPILGIGLGNYPITRNNPKYLGFIPPSPPGKNDAHGFGGLVQILVDGGLLMLATFLLIYTLFMKEIIGNNSKLMIFGLVFICYFMFGVQLYFLYPWFLFGLLITLKNKVLDETNLSY